MKKVLAVLLAVLMTFSVLTAGVAAEDVPTGTVYTYSSAGIPRIKARDGEVTILQAGDTIRFDTVKSDGKRLEVRYYPDAASIKVSAVTNTDWKENKIAQYNLDATKWELDEGQVAEDLMAKSPNYYKSFYNYAQIGKGEMAEISIIGLNGDDAYARDSANVDRGVGPIDFALPGAKFVGWALFNYGAWKATDKKDVIIEVYALWERGAAPETPDEPDDPVDPADPEDDSLNPIEKAYNTVISFVNDYIVRYLLMLPAALSTVIPNYLDGLIRNWLYGVFGIEA